METEMTKGDMAALRQRLAENADGILEKIAAEHGVSTYAVVEALPEDMRGIAPGSAFETVMRDLENWGEVLFIVHTADIVLECVGSIPHGSFGRGYFNLHGDSPIGGHIRAENCTHIAFIARLFMGKPSRSLQFFNAEGGAMFKIFVRRDENRELLAPQLASFDALRARLTANS